MTYQEFINNILQTRGRFACGDEYHERHHIIPRCKNGLDDDNNLIDLFAREHFIAHKLLAEENMGDDQLVHAYMLMAFVKDKNRSEAAKMSGNGGSTSCSPSTRKKIGEANKGKHTVAVYCPELNEEFTSIIEASAKYNVNKTSIGYCLNGKQKHAGKHPVTGEKLSWVRLENKIC